MAQINDIEAWEILDSRGTPTIKAKMTLNDGSFATFSVPSGASTGEYEAVELRDGEDRYMGKGVLRAIENINTDIKSSLMGIESSDQKLVDDTLIELDGSPNKSNLGANAILAVSIANAKATAVSKQREIYSYVRNMFMEYSEGVVGPDMKIPIPMFNIMNGGAHADNNLSFQEFMIVPVGVDEYPERLRAGVEIDWYLKGILRERGVTTAVGDEGGFAPSLPSDEVALDLILDACQKAGYRDGFDIKLGLDIAISQYYEDDDLVYALPSVKDGKPLVGNAYELIDYYVELINSYPILSIEDGLHEENWEEWELLMQRFESEGVDTLVVGDDLTVTNPSRVREAVKRNAMNAMIVKPNQIGTLTEVLEVAKICKENDIKIIVSHRSGETTDSFTADLAVALDADYIKDGAPIRGERVAKYNRLLEIDRELNNIL